jgi:hypothetical protein
MSIFSEMLKNWKVYIFHCTKCHHEWESAYNTNSNCDWCGACGKLFTTREPAALKTITLDLISNVLMLTGVYPKSGMDGKGIKKDRTEWQEGWNACYQYITDKVFKLDGLELSNEFMLLIAADLGWFDPEVKIFYLNMNDVFEYGSDVEEIDQEEVKEVARLFSYYGYNGVNYWVWKKRGSSLNIPKRDRLQQMIDINSKELEKKKGEQNEKSGL